VSADVSVIVASHNTHAYLERCLRALGESHEVIVVDSLSSDGSRELVRDRFPHVRLVELDANLGYGGALNRGVALASGAYLLLMNADAWPQEEAVERLVAFAESEPGAGVVGPRLVNPDGTLQPSVRGFPTLWRLATEYLFLRRLAPRSRLLNAFYGAGFDHRSQRNAEFLVGAVLLVRREVLDELGGFDERFFMYNEEVDLCYRARAAGWRVVFWPGAEFVHVGGASTAPVRSEMYREQLRSHICFLAKHRGLQEAERARKLMAMAMQLRALVFTVLARAERRRLSADAARWLRSADARTLLQRVLRRPDPTVSGAAAEAPASIAAHRLTRVRSAALLVAGVICLTVALDVIWLVRFRRGYVTEWDESGYLQFALSNFDALHDQGVWTFMKTVAGRGTFGPLLPFVTSLAYPIVTRGVFGSLLVLPLFFVGLVSATFGLARRLVSDVWAALAALCVAAIPAVTDYTRLYHFALPATACMTAALWALLRSEGFRRAGWAAAFGFFVALTLLSRTMTVGYVPGLTAAAGVQFLIVVPAETRVRLRNLGVAAATCGLVAGPWYVRNARSIYDYLAARGYGEGAVRFGRHYPITSWGYWTKELRIDLSYLQLPFAAAFLFAFVVALTFLVLRRTSPRVPRSAHGVALLTLVIVVLEGYLALTSSRAEGTAFGLPWLPALVVLGVAAAASIPVRIARTGFATVLVAVSVVAVASKSGWVPLLATPRAASVPGFGSVVVTDGRGVIQDEVEGSGYDIGSITEPMPKMHRRWLPVAREVVGSLYAEARARRRPLELTMGLDDSLFSWSRLNLAAQLWFHRYLPVDELLASSGGDTVASYRRQIQSPHREDVVITGEEMPGATITRSKVERAARSLGFVRVKSFALPDGRRIWIWWR
jgi:hypothetical protein